MRYAMVNKDMDTQVTHNIDGWTRLEHVDGYTVHLKSFMIDGKAVTVYLDDWSGMPISLHHYHLDNLVVDFEWANVVAEKYFYLENMWDLTPLKEMLPIRVYAEVEKAHSVFFDRDDY